MTSFLSELRRRNVFKVALAYTVVAWLLFQAALTFLPLKEGPSWFVPALAMFLVFGFGFIVFISWSFEATPEGLKRTESVPPDAQLPTWSRKKFAVFIITTAVLAASLLVFDMVRIRSKPTSPTTTTTP